VGRERFELSTFRLSAETISLKESFSVEEFKNWCLKEEKIRLRTFRSYIPVIKKYIREVGVLDSKLAEDWLSRYEHPKTFNDYLICLRKLFKFYGLRLNIKQKDARPSGLIIAPSLDEVKKFISAIKRFDVKVYFALLATQGIRPERLFKLTWSEVDLTRGWIFPKDGNVRSKFYRPQPIHPEMLEALKLLRRSSKSDRVFNFSPSTMKRQIRLARARTGMKLNRESMRKFFFNLARKTMDYEIVRWLMGHQLGVIQHYLADEVKEEYKKFVEKVGYFLK